MHLTKPQIKVLLRMNSGYELSKLTIKDYGRYELTKKHMNNITVASHTIKVLTKNNLIVILNSDKYFTVYGLTENAHIFLNH